MRPPWGSDPEDAGLLQFFFEKLNEVNPSCSKTRPLAIEYQKKTRKNSLSHTHFVRRLATLNTAARTSSIDRETQVKVLFLMSVCINRRLLEKLRLDAHIELDENNRIVKYRANDGNLNLQGEHHKSRKPGGDHEEKVRKARMKAVSSKPPEPKPAPQVPNHPPQLPRIDIPQNVIFWHPWNYYAPLMNHPPPSNLLNHPGYQLPPRAPPPLPRIQTPGCHLFQEPPPNPMIQGLREVKQEVGAPEAPRAPRAPESSKTAGSTVPIPKTTGSTKRAAPEVPTSSKRAKTDVVKTEDVDPDDSGGIPPKKPEAPNPKIQQLRQPKVEAPENPPATESPAPLDPKAQTVQKTLNLNIKDALGAPGVPEPPRTPAPAPEHSRAHLIPDTLDSRIDGAPRALGAPEPPAPEAPRPRSIPNNAPETREAPAPAPEASRPQSGPNYAYTPQIKFLETIQSLVLTLDRPNLSLLQTRITRKIRESSSNSWIPNDEISLALELLVAKLTNHSEPIVSEYVESISLKEFLCYLKAAILNSKLEGLEVLMEKINARIREPTLNEKSIPMVKVAGLLQTALNNVVV